MSARVTKCVAVLAFLLLISFANAQTLPPGTALPVMLRNTLDARRDKAGKTITARLMQNVILSDGVVLRTGARITGQVVSTMPATRGAASRIVVKFDQISTGKHQISITAHLRALASPNAVFEAQLPTNAIDDYGTSTSDWNTVQIGGAGVYRGSGQVMDGGTVIGKTTDYGAVTARLLAVPPLGCRASEREQALWLFSPSACAVYGYDDLRIVHRRDASPSGEVELESQHDVHIGAGSGWLLRTDQAPN
jgi:hypothetical protein